MRWTQWAESAEQNKVPITEALSPYFSTAKRVLELGSGTGQHAVHFAQKHPQLEWLPSERQCNLEMLRQNLRLNALSNVNNAIAIDASDDTWPQLDVDLVYSANTLHIMSWDAVCQLFVHLGQLLKAQQRFCVYGPFRFPDRPFATSNAAFDQYLKQQDALSGIRDIDALKAVASAHNLYLENDIEMPANNHVLLWQRT